MKIKLDENLPESLVPELTSLGHETDSVRMEGLKGQVDQEVWRAAQADGRFLITQDLDFSDARLFAPGTHAGVLLVRLSTPGRAALTARIVSTFLTEAVEEWHGCVVVATDRKVRVKR